MEVYLLGQSAQYPDPDPSNVALSSMRRRRSRGEWQQWGLGNTCAPAWILSHCEPGKNLVTPAGPVPPAGIDLCLHAGPRPGRRSAGPALQERPPACRPPSRVPVPEPRLTLVHAARVDPKGSRRGWVRLRGATSGAQRSWRWRVAKPPARHPSGQTGAYRTRWLVQRQCFWADQRDTAA